MAQRNNYLFVCANRRPDGTPRGSCAARGSVEIHALLKEKLKERGLSEVVARACTSSCLDACWVGPVIACSDSGGGYFYGRVQLTDIEEIVDALEKGTRVERLLLGAEEFLEPREVRQKE
jgi:(2Fe-2S) ferredoxin